MLVACAEASWLARLTLSVNTGFDDEICLDEQGVELLALDFHTGTYMNTNTHTHGKAKQ